MRTRAERNADFNAIKSSLATAIADIAKYTEATDEEVALREQLEKQEEAIANLEARVQEFS